MRRLAWMPIGLAVLATCSELDRPVEGSCGNRVLEAERGEDCDLGASKSADGFSCGQQSEQACHWLCNADHSCPASFVCDEAGVLCRQPSGSFELVHEDLARDRGLPLFQEIAGLWVSDIDGQAPSELLIQASDATVPSVTETDSVFATFFDDHAHAVELRRVRSDVKRSAPLATTHRVAGSDSLFVAPHPRLAGVLPLRGQPDGSLLPGLAAQVGGFSSEARLAPAVSQNETGTVGYVVIADQPHSALAFDTLFADPLPGYVLESPGVIEVSLALDSGTQIAPFMAAGRVNESTFEVLALALTSPDESYVRVYYQVFPFPVFDRIELPRGLRVAAGGGVWLGAIDADPYNDLLVSADDGSTYVAYGLGNGQFSASPTGEGLSAFGQQPLIEGAFPLAVGNIDGDDRADFVFGEFGIALSAADNVASIFTVCPTIQSDAAYVCGEHAGTFPTGGAPPWSEAVLADVNADGQVDVIAAGSQPEVDVYLVEVAPEASAALLRRHAIVTEGRPSTVAVADVDGDLVGDIAFHVDVTGAASLLVSFGATSGGPETPVKIADAGAIVDLKAVSTGKDLYLLSREADPESEVRWSTLLERTDRQLASPFLVPCFVEPGASDQVVPQQLAAGDFSHGSGGDVALLYPDCFKVVNAPPQDRLVLLPATSTGGLSAVLDEPLDNVACAGVALIACQQARRALRPVGIELDVPTGFSKSALMLAADLDGVAPDELILLGPDGDGQSRMLLVGSDFDIKPRFQIFADEPIAAQLGGPYDAWRGTAELADVDSDGLLDIVALTTPSEGNPVLVVLSFDWLNGVTPLRAASFTLGAEPVRAFALLDADLDGSVDDVMLATESGLFRATIDLAQTALAPQAVLDADGTSITGHFTRLIASDFDGDHLVDLAAVVEDESSAKTVRVYRSISRNP